ncbi:MAG: aminoacyl-tRNA hydrolase [bacterium]
MKLIIGLGNPGEKYELSRHNVGFLALDGLAKDLGLTFSEHKKTKSLLAKNSEFILLKPQTYMNLSGEAVVSALNFFKLTKEDLVVIHDDKDIELGKFKLAPSSRAAGNNGVKSIIDSLGSQDFFRIRVGIKSADLEMLPLENFVLGRFKKSEVEIIKNQFDEIKKIALQ